jgi:hypothetical protein
MQNQCRVRFIICGAVLMRNVFAYTLVAINTTAAARSRFHYIRYFVCTETNRQQAGQPVELFSVLGKKIAAKKTD